MHYHTSTVASFTMFCTQSLPLLFRYVQLLKMLFLSSHIYTDYISCDNGKTLPVQIKKNAQVCLAHHIFM